LGIALARGASAEALDELLDSRALESVAHPIAAQFLAEEGAAYVSAERATRATAQLKVSLQRQTNAMALMLRGTTGAMSTPSMQRMLEQSSRGTGVGGIVRSALGFGGAGAAPQVDPEQMERETQQAMAEPWVRGIGAARALAGLGDANSAATFYVACLQMLEAEWVPGACLEDIIGLGPRRAEVLLVWMLENADKSSFVAFDVPLPDEDRPAQSTVQLRNAALEGLGALIGSGLLSPESREQAFAAILGYSSGRDNEPYMRGVAEGLARSKDPRAVAILDRLAEQRGFPDVRQAAFRGLAVGFGERAALDRLRRGLNDGDMEVQLRAAQALYETGDEAAFEWAVEVITERRTASTEKPDVRAQVVRDLVELGGEAGLRTLREALDEGARNDWVEAWIAVGLLELGDTSAAAGVEAALTIDDWELDPRGLRSIWRAIKPWLQYATQLAMSGGMGAMSSTDQLRQVTALIGDAVTSERGRHLQKLDQRQSLTAQLRWQAADAIAAARPAGAIDMLRALLADPTPGVHSSAALALARVDMAEALPLLTEAYATALATSSTTGFEPELRATLVRAALLQAPAAPTTAELLERASVDPDPGVRFIALAFLESTKEVSP
jgi:HEAT repeat protein